MQQAHANTAAKTKKVSGRRVGGAAEQSRVLRVAIEKKLSRDRRLRNSSVHVVVTDDGFVTLTGMVETAYDRISAHNAAWFTPGVVAVDNRLRLAYPSNAPQKSSDFALQSLLNNVFRRHPDLDEQTITPIVHGHIATLWGTCDSYWKKLRAQEATATSADFSAVLDYLAIVSSGDPDDERIGEEAMRQLADLPGVDAQYVVVRVEPGGTVMLSGTVSDEDARESAFAAVRRIAGVKRVTAKGLIAESPQKNIAT